MVRIQLSVAFALTFLLDNSTMICERSSPPVTYQGFKNKKGTTLLRHLRLRYSIAPLGLLISL